MNSTKLGQQKAKTCFIFIPPKIDFCTVKPPSLIIDNTTSKTMSNDEIQCRWFKYLSWISKAASANPQKTEDDPHSRKNHPKVNSTWATKALLVQQSIWIEGAIYRNWSLIRCVSVAEDNSRWLLLILLRFLQTDCKAKVFLVCCGIAVFCNEIASLYRLACFTHSERGEATKRGKACTGRVLSTVFKYQSIINQS